MRTFFGLELPADVAMQIADWRDRQLRCAGRPVPPANFHITLAFIGEIAPGPLERLCLAVDSWLEHEPVPGAQLVLDCPGYWPKPGIYWLGPGKWPEPLALLANKLRHLATSAGARRDRNPFRPHVTLYRNCSTPPAAAARQPAISLPYLDFTLFESKQGKTGVSYHPLQQWDLLSLNRPGP
jgi:2'-5' RNA ligase